MKCEKCSNEQAIDFIVCPKCYFNAVHDKSISKKIFIGKLITAISIPFSILFFLVTNDVKMTLSVFGSFFLLGIIMIISYTNEKKRIERMRISIVNSDYQRPSNVNEPFSELKQQDEQTISPSFISECQICNNKKEGKQYYYHIVNTVATVVNVSITNYTTTYIGKYSSFICDKCLNKEYKTFILAQNKGNIIGCVTPILLIPLFFLFGGLQDTGGLTSIIRIIIVVLICFFFFKHIFHSEREGEIENEKEYGELLAYKLNKGVSIKKYDVRPTSLVTDTKYCKQ